MMNLCKKRRLTPKVQARLRKVIFWAFILSLPTLIINLIVQGRREFKAELETNKKYKMLTDKALKG
ncbi:hypothetical protein [Acutalibacter sp. 1XD8-36]|uniref:hypothetical protein n=1 Tax=Acutalibacter sp. 1XD8-36 TaxID=2320852 RepID=UPI00261A6547|nr:hypothetical protein [Acutalibacter sp. 1XD8-36]